MKCKYSKVKFLWALWLGIGLFLGAIGLNGLLNWLDISSIQQCSGFNMIESTGYFVGFLWLVLALPIIEEFVFRFWGRNTKWAYIIGIVLIPIVVMLLSVNWIAGVSLFVVLLLSYLLFKGDARMILFMIITSIGFGFSHAMSFSELNLSAMVGVLELMGLGFVMSFLAINYGLIWAILGHSLNNLIAFIMILLPLTFETEHYNVTIRPIGNTNGGYVENAYMGDTMILKGDAELFASILTHEQDMIDGTCNMDRTTFYRMGKLNHEGFRKDVKNVSEYEHSKIKQLASSYYALPKYEMTVVPKRGVKEHDYYEILRGLEDNMLLRLDTTYEPLYLMKVHNNLFLNVPKEERKGTLGGLILDMQLLYDFQLMPDDGVNLNTPVAIDYSDIKGMSLDECAQYLKRNYGIELKKAKEKGVRIITYYGL